MAGRHRMRFADARNPRGLRPLTVIALCSVVAVLAVLLTQTVHPQGAASGGASVNSAGQGNTAPAATDPGTADQSDDATPSDDSSSSAPAAAPAVPPVDPVAPPAAPPAAPPPPPAPAPVPVPGHPTPSPSPSPTPSPAPPPPSPTSVSYEAESSANSMPGTKVMTCTGCSGRKKVGDIGKGMGWLRFNGVTAAAGGSAMIVIGYVNGGSNVRTAQLIVNGGAPIALTFARTADWSTTGWLAVRITLNAGTNNLEFTNSSSAAPDFDRITVLS